MPLTEDQLSTWTRQGSITQSAETYRIVRETLTAQGVPYGDHNYQVFLQGSYANDTNVWRESDVDIVIVLNECWHSDLSGLSADAQSRYDAAFVAATYGYPEFKRDVTQALTDRFGPAVEPGSKAISINALGNRRKVDVLVAVQYRRYYAFATPLQQDFAEGICFWDSAGQQIVNFPRQHAQNLTAKHQATGGRLKPLIRAFKNLRSWMVEEGDIGQGVAPSYYLEGLLYNVPDHYFMGTLQAQAEATLRWMRVHPDGGDFECPNRQFYLVRDHALTCWPRGQYRAFAAALAARI